LPQSRNFNALAVSAARIGNAQPVEAQESHAHAENLARAQVPMRGFSLPQKFVDRFHGVSVVSICSLVRRSGLTC
jgi:hypothetical protein